MAGGHKSWRRTTWLIAGLLVVGATGCARDARPEANLGALDSTAPAAPTETTEQPTEPPERIEVRVLVVAHEGVSGSEATRTQEQALERARMLAGMAKAGDPMEELVRQYSERPGAKEDGGLFKLRTDAPAPFDEEVVAAALAVEPSQVSAPVQTPEGYLILQRHPDPPPGPEQIAARHILIAYAGSPRPVGNPTRTEAEARALAERVVRLAREPDADWGALAAEYTDEPGSQQTGGDLGTFGRGAMVPAFERAAFTLEVGEVSDAVQSPFGFHVITRYR